MRLKQELRKHNLLIRGVKVIYVRGVLGYWTYMDDYKNNLIYGG
jgi:hypothetical protein